MAESLNRSRSYRIPLLFALGQHFLYKHPDTRKHCGDIGREPAFFGHGLKRNLPIIRRGAPRLARSCVALLSNVNSKLPGFAVYPATPIR